MKIIHRTVLYFFLFLSIITTSITACDSIEQLQSAYSIENNILITASGEKYTRYPFESKLHFDLSYYMKDLDAANQVYKAYKTHILPFIVKMAEDGTSNAANEAFSRALIQVCLLFGNPSYSPESSFFSALTQQGKYGIKITEDFSCELKQFVTEANKPLYAIHKKNKPSTFTIVIITTTASGGNNSVAEALADFLGKQENIHPILIDFEEIAQECDPIKIATDIYTYDMIYSSIFQKTNDLTVLKKRKILNREIQQFIPNKILANLKKKISNLNPDLIISTRAYTSDDLGLATLGIPFKMLHTDFELCPSLCSYYTNVNVESIRFWLTSFSPSMFKPLFENSKCLNLYNEHDDIDTCLKKISDTLNIPFQSFKEKFELIGYPCSKFYQITEGSQLQAIRKKWGIEKNEIPIFIMMGKHGTRSLNDAFDHLLHAKTDLPLKYIFICGKNHEQQQAFKQKMLDCGFDTKHFAVFGLLSPEEINEVMNVCTMGVSKAGGATVVEASITGKHLLLMHSHPWEQINGLYLSSLGLATFYNPELPLIEQIENCLKTCSSTKGEARPLEDWRKNLMQFLDTHIDHTKE